MLEWRWRGVDFRLSLLFPATVIVMLSLDDGGFTALCLLAAVIHELGHFFAMVWLDDAPARLTMGVFGIRVERNPGARLSYPELCVVSLAGPLANVVGCAVCWATNAHAAALIHGVLAFFHLLPVTSLDGGEALYSLLCCRYEETRAERILFVCSAVVVFPLAVLGFWMLIASGYNFTLLFLSGYLILRMFLRAGH